MEPTLEQKQSLEAAMEKLSRQLDVAFNPITGVRSLTFTVIMAQPGVIAEGSHFPTSHISNADSFGEQVAMAKAFIAKCEDMMAESGGVM